MFRQPLRAITTDHRPPRPRRCRRAGVLAALVATGLVGACTPAAALANDAAFKAAVPFSNGRTTDLRAGEPLEFFFRHEKVTKVCLSPAPIQHAACGTGFLAPPRAGTEKVTVTLASGSVKHESLTIGAPATHLVTFANAGLARARVVEFEATCDADGYDEFDGHHLKGPSDATKIHTGDRLGAFYIRANHAIFAMPYATGEPRLYDDHCLRQLHR